MNYNEAVDKIASYEELVGKTFIDERVDFHYVLEYITAVSKNAFDEVSTGRMTDQKHLDSINGKDLFIVFVCICEDLDNQSIIIDEKSFTEHYTLSK